MSDNSKAVAVTEAPEWNSEQLALIKRTVADGASNDELAMFLHQARRTGLDPLARQIHFVKRGGANGRGTIQVGIDGYRLIADRTGLYAGNDDPVYTYGDDPDKPVKATVTVWKIVHGQRCPFTATARWSEYAPDGNQGFMWKKMPHLMLGKVAEALALRKAFPAELSGVYVDEEMHQAEEPEPRPEKPVSRPVQQQPAIQPDKRLLCADCGEPITALKTKAGTYTAVQVAERTRSAYGRDLCFRCGEKEAAKRQRQQDERPRQPDALDQAVAQTDDPEDDETHLPSAF